jgi:DNA-binding XRE family transcriptional regulator
MVAGEIEVRRTVAGRVYTGRVAGERCDTCAEGTGGVVEGLVLEAFERSVARELLEGSAGAEALKFVRTAHGLTRPDLAALLGVEEARVKGWESGEEVVGEEAWAMVKKVVDLV